MASKQTKPDNKAAGGSSPIHKLQEQFSGLQNQTQKTFKDLKVLRKQDENIDQMFEKFRQEIKQFVNEKCDQLKQNILTVATAFSKIVVKIDEKVEEISSEVETKMKEVEYKISNMNNKVQGIENAVTMMQFRSMEFAVRLRGIKETNGEDLRRVCAGALAVMLKVNFEEVSCKIDRAYRVNSWVAKQRQLPRDVVIYFTDKRIRNDIVQKSFVSTLQVNGREIVIFKELPSKILRDRKDFGFLVAELKKKQIPFRWDAPVGITLRYQGEGYQLNTVEKAEEFYFNVFKIDSTSQHTFPVSGIQEGDKEKQNEQEIGVQSKQMEKAGPPKNTKEVALELDLMSYEVKEQCMNRLVNIQVLEKQQWQRSKSPQVKKRRSRFYKTKKF